LKWRGSQFFKKSH